MKWYSTKYFSLFSSSSPFLYLTNCVCKMPGGDYKGQERFSKARIWPGLTFPGFALCWPGPEQSCARCLSGSGLAFPAEPGGGTSTSRWHRWRARCAGKGPAAARPRASVHGAERRESFGLVENVLLTLSAGITY